jgi:hypothetical protein
MRKSNSISTERFRGAYQKVGWIEKISKDGRYIVWQSPRENDVWIVLPKSEEALDYAYYAQKNVLMLLYALDLPENQSSIDDLISQLRFYNYKLVNRIVGNTEFKSDSVPYELASLLPQKNIEAFRHFYLTSKTSRRSIPIEKFQLNHTEVGSFVIPVSILVEEESNTTLVPLQSETNIVLHDYLKMVDSLLKIPAKNPVTYAEKIIGESIDSKIVKDFLGKTNSIAKAKEKYGQTVKNVTITGSGSSLLDFNLGKPEKEFQIVDLGHAEVLEDDFIREIERLEIAIDDSKVEEYQANVDVVVDNIDRNGNVKFTVTAINGSEIKKPFKANSSELTKARLDLFAEFFKNDGSAVVRGDITKSKGRMGKIIIDTVGPEREDSNTQLFNR